MNILVFLTLLLPIFPTIDTIKCLVGYGQRGLRYSNQLQWNRECPGVKYCFEVVSTDVNQMRRLIDYPWNSYYSQYYIRSCGGDLGLPLDYHPWRELDSKALRKIIGSVTVNVTTPRIITGQGSTEQLDLRYTCRHDLCTKNPQRASASRHFSIGSTLAAVLIHIVLITNCM